VCSIVRGVPKLRMMMMMIQSCRNFACDFTPLHFDETVSGEGLRPLACWDCGFQSRRAHGYLSLANFMCCQVVVSATGRSLVQRSPTDCGVSLCV
jgi:acyl dehydratase